MMDKEKDMTASEPPSASESDAPDSRLISERPKNEKVDSSSFRLPTDLETGKPLDHERGMVKTVMPARNACDSQARRRTNFKKAMSPLRKRRSRLFRKDLEIDDDLTTSMHGRLMVQASRINSTEGIGEEDDEETGSDKSKGIQYRLSAERPRRGLLYRFLGLFGCTVGTAGIYEDDAAENSGCLCCGCSPNRWVTTYLNWTFRASFFKVLFSAALGFYALTLFFALLIFASGTNHPRCVHVNGKDFGQSGPGDRFSDAYALSWTTFSTVVRRRCSVFT